MRARSVTGDARGATTPSNYPTDRTAATRTQTPADTNPRHRAGRIRARLPSRRLAGPGLALTAGLAVLTLATTATAAAVSRPQLPFRCFAPVDVRHVVFGAESFYLPTTVQGPSSFREDAGPHLVTYPLHHGTSNGSPVAYVITDASDLKVARELGVNYTPKLQQALGSSAVEVSSSFLADGGNGIHFPATVDFSPARVLMPSATGFPPIAAQPGAVGAPGVQPSGPGQVRWIPAVVATVG
jgi:hypothetical protein